MDAVGSHLTGLPKIEVKIAPPPPKEPLPLGPASVDFMFDGRGDHFITVQCPCEKTRKLNVSVEDGRLKVTGTYKGADRRQYRIAVDSKLPRAADSAAPPKVTFEKFQVTVTLPSLAPASA